MNAKVAAIIDRIKAGGYEIKELLDPLSEYSKKVWVDAKRKHLCPLYPETGHPMLNESLYGWIGPRGAFELHYSVGTYHDDKVNRWWRLRSITEPKKPSTPNEEIRHDDGTEKETPTTADGAGHDP